MFAKGIIIRPQRQGYWLCCSIRSSSWWPVESSNPLWLCSWLCSHRSVLSRW